MRIALAQLNPVVGDIEGNVAALRLAYRDAVEAGALVVVATELTVTGYPPEDLLLKRGFVTASEQAVRELAAETSAVPLVVGFVERLADEPTPDQWPPPTTIAVPSTPLANAAAVLRDGQVAGIYRKQRLPNYGVFDEARYFQRGHGPLIFDCEGVALGVTICEDLWGRGGPVAEAAAAGARVVLSLNASPYHRGKRAEREAWARHHAEATGATIVYVNHAGGQDEVVFDGDSFVLRADGEILGRGAQFASDLVVVDLDAAPGRAQLTGGGGERLDPVTEVYAALVLGTRDYVMKNGFRSVVVGLSGGIDSAVTAVVAADALGADAVTGVAMPSPYSSPGSLTDAKALAQNLGIRFIELPITMAMEAFEHILAGEFAGTAPGVAEENIQSRIRGTLLMAMSNKFGPMVLSTGNKSEYAVGYSTLYGDMAGGFAVLKDVPKTLVYELARHRNAVSGTEFVPQSILTKPPSAELRPDQRDTDSLPPYDLLDPILESYVERDRSIGEIVAAGHDEATVRRIVGLVDGAEYKRRQAPPGVKITRRAFGKDRRPPITQSWSG